MNKVPGSIPKLSVAATHPNIKGMAPGKAPTKTASGVIVFKGVYTLVYKNMEIAPNMAVFGFKKYKLTIPTNVRITARVMAVFTDILPDGMGLFLVRFIKASDSFSTSWLYALDAATMQLAPHAKSSTGERLASTAPRKYPAMEEKTTLMASPA